MATVQDEILTTFFKEGRDGTEMLPSSVIISECEAAGYDASAVEDELATLVERGQVSRGGDHYAIAGAAEVSLTTHRGDDSMPWQFSLVRTPDEILISQAKAGPDKFDPVLKRFTIEATPVGAGHVDFHHSVSRRVWQENPEQPHIKSQRSEGRIFELLYRDPDGWHLARPDPDDETTGTTESSEYGPTDHPGVTVSATYLRSEEDGELKFTEDRDYRITEDILNRYAEVYVLSYYELNEESQEKAVWKTEDAVAYHLHHQ
jgi:hypothetical protein